MTPLASLDQLTKRFGALTAVEDFSLTLHAGLVHGFLGPNGAGKSTAIRCLLGLYAPSAGHVRLLGEDPRQHPEVLRRVSYVPGDVTLWPNLTGRQVLDALAALRGGTDEERERELIAAFRLDVGKKVRSYSKGNRQKVALVAAFSARTELLVLDEPTSGLDPLMEQVFSDCVRRATADGRGVLLSSHDLAEVERLCEQITIIKDGRLVESGCLTALRHLASSQLRARLPHAERVMPLLEAWHPTRDGDEVTLQVPPEHAAEVLAVLASHHPTELTCTPTTLEDLFLRHYQVAAR